MTKQEAKDLTIEVWEVLADDGEIMEKYEIPIDLYNQIKDLYFECPLCELFNDPELGVKEHLINCIGCPLKEAGQQCFSRGDFYSTWEKDYVELSMSVIGKLDFTQPTPKQETTQYTKCPYCGYETPVQFKKCSHCGAVL